MKIHDNADISPPVGTYGRVILGLFLLSALSFPILAQEGEESEFSPFKLGITPAFLLPLSAESAYLSPGGIVSGAFSYHPPFLPGGYLQAELGYSFTNYNQESLFSTALVNGIAGYVLTLSERFSISASAGAGYSYSFVTIAGQNVVGGGLSIIVGLSGRFSLLPWLDIYLSANFRSMQRAYFGVSFELGSSVQLPKPKKVVEYYGRSSDEPIQGNLIELSSVDFTKVFPVFYFYYEDHPVGKATIVHNEEEPLLDVSVSLLVNEYMEAAKPCGSFEAMEAGKEYEVDLNALFVDRVLEITEGKKVTAEITVEYKKGEQRYRDDHVQTLEIAFRNAMTWDDDKKAAAFVTARDPHVRAFAGNVGSVIKETEYTINPNLGKAIAYFEALKILGMNYQRDPSTPYEELSVNTLQVDSLQFPRETLGYRAGDCDDLSILCSALLESVFVPTAFITVPGHIYLALSLDIAPREAQKAFAKPEDLIFLDDQTWLPFEVTALDRSFLEAWQMGAKEWREYYPAGQAGFFPIQDAWNYYKPVGLPSPASTVSMPDMEKVAAEYSKQVVRFVDQQIFSTVEALTGRIEGSNGSSRWVNKLAVLYSRYGLYDRAITEFEKILEAEEYVPALLNVGMIYFVRGDMLQAQSHYDRALAVAPDDPAVVLSLARVNHELENYGTVRTLYAKLQDLDEKLAQTYAYLDMKGDEASRAADAAGIAGKAFWIDEENDE